MKERSCFMHLQGKFPVFLLFFFSFIWQLYSLLPRPCYESLTNNVSTPLLQTKLNTWPEGTGPFVKHHVLKDYIQDTSNKAGVDDITKFGARVTRVHKDGSTWTVHWSTLSEGQDPVENEESGVSSHLYTGFRFCVFRSGFDRIIDV